MTTLVAASLCCIIFLSALFLPSERRGASLFGFSSYALSESEESFLNRRTQEVAEQFKLTKRESEVAHLLAQGLHINNISEELFISPLTTKTHLRNIYAKTNVHSQNDFMHLLYEGGETSPNESALEERERE